MSNERINFYYDPARQGYDTALWKTITGAPASTGTALRFTSAKAIGYADLFKSDVTFAAITPTVPNAFLTGDTGATAVIATWNAVLDGEFAITVDGVTRNILGLDFSLAADMDAVAAIIQVGLRAATGKLETVVWSTDHFVITSISAITVTSAIALGGGTDISGAGAADFMDADVGNGVVTAASDREFGLEQITAAARIFFKIKSGVFSCESLFNGKSSSTVVAWNSAWTAAKTLFTIKWTGFSIEFLINGVVVATVGGYTGMSGFSGVSGRSDDAIPNIALSTFVDNNSADNFDISYLEVQNTQGYM